MATKVASLYADVSANIGKFSAAMGAMKGQLTGAASSLAAFSTLALGAFTGAAVGVIAFKKAIEFADQGAQIGQTESAFNSLATTLGQGPDLLYELQTATRGTVSELDLMRSTSTLLMGTSGDLGRQLAENAPQLAAIAQAAHDLNPTMGTTAEMYDRLSRGIKKAEPELLDEVGILMNLTQVYKEYAKAHGITVSAMDKTMKTEAMLNAVLTQGNVLIEQAGRVTNSTATQIDQMQANLENTGNSLKADFAPAVATVVSGLNMLVTADDQIIRGLQIVENDAGKTAESFGEYDSAVRGAAAAAGMMIGNNGELVNSMGQIVDRSFAMTAGMWANMKSMQGVNNASAMLSGGLSQLDNIARGVTLTTSAIDGGLSMLGQTFPEVTEAVGASEAAITTYGERLTALGGYYAELEAAEQNRITTAGLMAGIQGTLGDATASYSATLAQLTEQETQITDALVRAQEQGYSPTSQKVTELTEALKLNQEAQGAALENLQGVTAEMLYQQAAAGLDTQASLDLARSMGVLSEADYTVATAMQQLREQFDANHDGMITATEDASGFAAAASAMTQAIQSVQAKNLPLTASNIAKELDAMAKTNAESALSELAGAAEEGAEPLSDVAAAAADAGAAAEDAAGGLEDQNDALGDTQSAAQRAVAGLSAAASAARNATQPLRTAATAAAQLAGSLQDIPGRTSIVVTTSGVDSAIAELERLAGVIGSIPTNLTINVSVASTTPTTTSTQSPITSSYETALPAIVSETYNIYDPLAAAILAEQKSMATRDRLEAVMRG